METDDYSLHLAKVWISEDVYYNRCEVDDEDIMLERCEFVDPTDRSTCITCLEGTVWDPIEKVCSECSDLIEDCATCEFSEFGGIMCTQCSGDLEIWHETGTCWESHCEISSMFGDDAC